MPVSDLAAMEAASLTDKFPTLRLLRALSEHEGEV